jgi:5-methylcytosine-specific restriction endonuclease McrA
MYGRFTFTPDSTVQGLLVWSYANLAMAHAAVTEKAAQYGPRYYAIRTRLHKDLLTGQKSIRTISDDERLKMSLPQTCCYCGSNERLSIDHMIPQNRGGLDIGENMVWACRPCNSSKSATDMLEWFKRKGHFPPLLLLRRYLKVVHQYCSEQGLLDVSVSQVQLPYVSLSAIPLNYPPPSALRLWIIPLEADESNASQGDQDNPASPS